METIKFYKVKTKWLKWYFTIGTAEFVTGILLFVFVDWKDDTHWLDISFPFLITIQGIMFIMFTFHYKKWDSYFFSWDDDKLEFLLPKSKESKSIQITEINDIKIHPKVIAIKTSSDEVSINLDNVQFHELKKIKEKFEKIKASL